MGQTIALLLLAGYSFKFISRLLAHFNHFQRGIRMRKHLLLMLLFLNICGSAVAAEGKDKVIPLPLPKSIRVQSAGPRGKVWERLSPKEKLLVFHLTQAADAGRDL